MPLMSTFRGIAVSDRGTVARWVLNGSKIALGCSLKAFLRPGWGLRSSARLRRVLGRFPLDVV
jgi:hypothetical protein